MAKAPLKTAPQPQPVPSKLEKDLAQVITFQGDRDSAVRAVLERLSEEGSVKSTVVSYPACNSES